MMLANQEFVIEAKANFSDCGRYRYWLSRRWGEDLPMGCFICTNPSKATALYSDLTMSNCTNLAVQWGGGFYILNLFAYIATDPKDLPAGSERVGPMNDQAIRYIIEKCDFIVLAWGNGNKVRSKHVLELLKDQELFCISNNEGGGYLHPSRISYLDYPNPSHAL